MADIVKFSISKEEAIDIFHTELKYAGRIVVDEGDYLEISSPMTNLVRCYVKINDDNYEIGHRKGLHVAVNQIIQIIESNFDTAVGLRNGTISGLGAPAQSNNAKNNSYTIDDFNDALDSIERMKKMMDEGILTEEEFNTYKEKLLSGNLNSNGSKKTEKKEESKSEENQPEQESAEILNEKPVEKTSEVEETQTVDISVEEEAPVSNEVEPESKTDEKPAEDDKPHKQEEEAKAVKPIKEKKPKAKKKLSQVQKFKIIFFSALAFAICCIGVSFIFLNNGVIFAGIIGYGLLVAVPLMIVFGIKWKKANNQTENL